MPASAKARGASSSDDHAISMDPKKARKREMDRICQQRKRQKDRDTVRKLEARLKSLQQRAGDRFVYDMVIKHEKDQARISRHQQRMKQIQTLLQADMEDLGDGDDDMINQNGSKTHQVEISTTEDDCDAALFPDSEHSLDAVPIDSENNLTWANASTALFDQNNSTMPLLDLSALPPFSDPSSFDNGFLDTGMTLQPFAPELPGESDLINKGASFDSSQCGNCETVWTATNKILHRVRDLSNVSVNYRDGLDAHIIILAVTQGWNEAMKTSHLDSHWEYLRQLDELCFPGSGDVERLAALRMLRRMLKCGGMMGQDPLPFLRPRPSQLQLAHPAVADYFVWPGFRERIIFGHGEYCNNTFSKMFASSFRFLWPFEVRDTYVQNRETRLFHFSSTFLERTEDLRCWCMEVDFVNAYPEFRGDIPLFNSRAPQLDFRSDVTQWQYFPSRPEIEEDGSSSGEECMSKNGMLSRTGRRKCEMVPKIMEWKGEMTSDSTTLLNPGLEEGRFGSICRYAESLLPSTLIPPGG